ncbi:MAG: CpaF family protein [Deltaproteobacteria bacterium]|nr:CpaF family protein [Deltaproteobacteria bacterium]
MTYRSGAYVSAEEIRQLYFGASHLAKKTDGGTSALLAREVVDLTSSARFVVSEARRILSEERARGAIEQHVDEETLLELVRRIESQHGEDLGEREARAVVQALQVMRLDYDVLTPLIENPEVSDVIVKNWKDISVQVRGRKNLQTDLRFHDESAYKAFVQNLLKRVGKACTVKQSIVDAAIESDIRVCVTHESFSPPGSGPMLTIRIARHKDVSIEKLATYQLAPREILDYLAMTISTLGNTALIAGEVGTGKTTLARALASVMPEQEAILVIEDTHEIVLNRPFVRTLLTREDNIEGVGRITPSRAIRTGMRMAMNRVVLGEMRDGETAEAFIDVCSSGHAGLSTIHARSARDALGRLELLLSRVRSGVGAENIRREIANAVGIVVHLAVDKTGRHRIMEVLELGSAADGLLQVQPMFAFVGTERGSKWKRLSGVSRWDRLLRNAGVNMPAVNCEFGFGKDAAEGSDE